MPAAKTQTSETTTKKPFRKKQGKKATEGSSKTTAAKTTTKASKSPVKSPKGSKAKISKEASTEAVVPKVKVEKAPKKINNKPTLADTCGLNFAVAKVRNIICNLSVNRESFFALKDLNSTEVSMPSEETAAYVKKCFDESFEEKQAAYLKSCLSKLSHPELVEFVAAKEEALKEFQKSYLVDELFGFKKFDVVEFAKTYKELMKDFSEVPKFASVKEVMDVELNEKSIKELVSTVSSTKIRFNSEAKIFITAFVEFIIKQLVINGTKNCINEKKKIIKLEHAIKNILPEFTMIPFITSTKTYKTYDTQVDDEEEDDEDEEEEPVEDLDSPDKKQQFRYYVSELCRNVRMELSSADSEQPLTSKYNQTSVSKEFKQFCSDVIIDILHMFGNVLKVEVTTRKIKTVNYAIINALIQNAHILYNVDSADTIAFIQEKYNVYTDYLVKRSKERAEKVEAKEGVAPLESEVETETEA